jgi:hypothetical protein
MGRAVGQVGPVGQFNPLSRNFNNCLTIKQFIARIR